MADQLTDSPCPTDAILLDAARYRFTCLNAACIAAGRSPNNLLKSLADESALDAHARALPGNVSYWTLTNVGARRANQPERSRKLDGNNLDLACALRWWGTLEGKPGRARLNDNELKNILGDASPAANIPHVIAEFDSICSVTRTPFPAVYRVYLPAKSKSAADVIRKISGTFEALLTSKLSPWVTDFDYGFLVLVESPHDLEAIEIGIDARSLRDDFLISVALAPRAASYARFLRSRR